MSRRNNSARDQRHQKSQNIPGSSSNRNASGSSQTPTQRGDGLDLAAKVAAAVMERTASVDVQVDAIQAAVEILAANATDTNSSSPKPSLQTDSTRLAAESVEKTARVGAPSKSTASLTEATTAGTSADKSVSQPGAAPKPATSKTEATKSADGSNKSNPLAVILSAFREGLTDLKTSLRDEFRSSLTELQTSQAAAAASQSEVLRTLTEVMFQSAATPREPGGAGLEAAIAGLEDRLLLRLNELKSEPNAPASQNNDRQAAAKTPAKSGLSVTTVKLKEASSVVSRSWEQIRNEMIASGGFGEGSESTERQIEQLPEVAPLTSDRHFRLPEQDPTLEVPKAVDPDSLSLDELRDAFREREAFVTTLIARIRRQQESTQATFSKEQLRELVTELPDELSNQVRQTLKQMEDLARMGELELSLERARVARQVNQLEHTRQILEHNARQLGLTLNPDGSIAVNKNPVVRNSSSRRWLGKLGFGQ